MKAGQPTGHHPSAGAQTLLRPGGDLGQSQALHHGALHAQRVPLLVGRDGGEEGRLAGCATTVLAAASLPAEPGIIEFDPPAEGVRAISLHHHMHITCITCISPVSHAPRRVVRRSGDYVLAGRGYSTAVGLDHVVSAGGHVTVRVNTGSLPFSDDRRCAVRPVGACHDARTRRQRTVLACGGGRGRHRGAGARMRDREDGGHGVVASPGPVRLRRATTMLNRCAVLFG